MPNKAQRDLTDRAAPLYLEVICNQFPEAQRVLTRIVTMCRYKAHTGFTMTADDYKVIMKVPFLSDALQRVTSQAAHLYSLNKSITDLTDKKATADTMAQKLGINLTKEGLIDPEEYQTRMDKALATHKKSAMIFKQIIQDIDLWIDENLDAFKAYEENIASTVLEQLQTPLDDTQAEAMVEKSHPDAPDKAERISTMKRQYDAWREKALAIFSLPVVERRVALAHLLSKA